jgi:hypothetical protein
MSSHAFLLRAVAISGLMPLLSACDNGKDENKADDAKVEQAAKSASSADKAIEKIDDHVAKEVAKELSDEARFGKDMRKKGCELLTPKLVADAFGVPEGEVKQTKVMGCIYNWKADGQIVEANITLLRTHKSEKLAAQWLEKATQTQTKEQMAAQMQEIKGKVKEREEVDTKLKEETADTLLNAATDMLPDEGVTYEDVDGVGDQARINTGDGTLWVRVDNLTFNVTAFKGKEMEQPEYTAADMKNIKKVTAMAQQAQQAWLKENVDQRRADSIKVAKLIVANLK